MRKFLVLGLLLLAVVAGYAREDQADRVKVGDTMPAFTIVRDDGSKIASSDFKGKVILVNFFATWCPPCQKELAEAQKSLWPKYKDRQDFVFLVIGREHSDADLVKYNKKKKFDFPLYPDKDRAVFAAFADNLIPRSYLIDKDGRVIMATKGYTEEEFEALMGRIDEALNK